MSTTPSLTLRYNRQVELVFPHRRDLKAFRVGAADNLASAFAGTASMFQVRSGGTYRSPGIKTRRLGRTQYNNRELTRAVYDPQDFWFTGGDLPTDAQQSYVRVSEVLLDGTVMAEGPIYIVPKGGWQSTPRPKIAISATAPSLTTPTDFVPPDGALHVVLPQFADYADVFNKEAAGGDNLYVAFGVGEPGIIIPPATSRNIFDAAFKELYIWGDGAAVAFDTLFAIVNGEMG
jgi:hypothetical protein